MSTEYLVDTNILIYHTKGSSVTEDFIDKLLNEGAFNISILTKIEFLGWNKHTSEGFEKCRRLIEPANIYHVDDDIADKAIELRKKTNIKLADAIIAATAFLNNMKLATRNVDDFKAIAGLELFNPLE